MHQFNFSANEVRARAGLIDDGAAEDMLAAFADSIELCAGCNHKSSLIHDQAKAWESVCTALNQLVPNWHFTTDAEKTTADCAVETIRRLAALAAQGQGDGDVARLFSGDLDVLAANGFPKTAERIRAVLAEAPAQPRAVPDDLYRNACDSVESWKARALEVEETAERLVAAMNDLTGPTFMGEPALLKPVGMPDADDLAQLKKAMEDWTDDVDTDVPQHTLMRLTELGLLVAEQFEVTKKGMDLLAAAPQPGES